jgi:hypothetical protein
MRLHVVFPESVGACALETARRAIISVFCGLSVPTDGGSTWLDAASGAWPRALSLVPHFP